MQKQNGGLGFVAIACGAIGAFIVVEGIVIIALLHSLHRDLAQLSANVNANAARRLAAIAAG